MIWDLSSADCQSAQAGSLRYIKLRHYLQVDERKRADIAQIRQLVQLLHRIYSFGVNLT